MSHIRRHFIPGAPVFVTVVCADRAPHLARPARKDLLLSVLREAKHAFPYRMIGYVILDDHFHWLFHPSVAAGVPSLLHAVKLRFARRVPDLAPGSRVWQRRYWDHVIRDEDNLSRHLDYIHYNPVKHGLVNDPGDFRWSSFNIYLERGMYSGGWGARVPPPGIDGMESE